MTPPDWTDATSWLGDTAFERVGPGWQDTVLQHHGDPRWCVTVYVGDNTSITRREIDTADEAKVCADVIRARWNGVVTPPAVTT